MSLSSFRLSRVFHLGLSLALAASAVACAADTSDEPAADDGATAQSGDELQELSFTALPKPAYNQGPHDMTVIRSAAQHRTVFGVNAPYGVDFTREWIVSYRPDATPAGTTARILAHRAANNGPYVYLAGLKEIPDCTTVVPIGLSPHWAYGKIPASPSLTPITRFDSVLRACGGPPPVMDPALYCGPGQVKRVQGHQIACEARPATCVGVLCGAGSICDYASEDGMATCLLTASLPGPNPCKTTKCPSGSACTVSATGQAQCIAIGKSGGVN